MKQATKKMMQAGIERRFKASFGGGTLFPGDPDKISKVVTDTIFSAIAQGFDKIRLSDDLHLRVKRVKGGYASSNFMARDINGNLLDPERKQLPDRIVVTLVSTPALDAACDVTLHGSWKIP